MSFRVEEIEKNIRNLNTKLCCIQKQIEQGATLEGENAIVYVGAEGVLQTSVDNLRYSETGLFIKGIDTQNVLTINNHLDASLLTLTNSGILTFGVNELNLLTDLSVQNDLLYFDTINNRIGVRTSTPLATIHAKGNSDSVGNVFVAENLSNTANVTIANNGVTTFNFGTGGKVYIAGAVGSGDILLEIRRTTSSSGGFTFRSGNALSQEIHTTNGSMYLVTSASNSDIYFSTGTGRVFVDTILANMTGFNTGYQFRVGQQGGSILHRWLNFGHSSTYSQILQAVQNGLTPAVDRLSLSPYGGGVTLYGNISGNNVDVSLIDGSTNFRVYRGATATAGIFMQQSTGGSGRFLIGHLDTTNSSGNANIFIEQGDNAVFAAGKQGGATSTKNHFYGQSYGTINNYNLFVGHSVTVSGSERGIVFSTTNVSTSVNIIQAVHSGTGKPLSLNYYGGNVSIGNILSPTTTLQVKGNSDSVGSSFRVENLSNTFSLDFSNGGILTLNTFGSGSNFSNFYIESGGVGAYHFRVISGYRILNFNVSSGSNSVNGISSGSSTSLGMQSANITLGTSLTNMTNNVVVGWNQGLFNNTYTKTDNLASNLLSVRGLHAITSGAGSVNSIDISPTINQTGGTTSITGINYNPTLTSILGAHYGILVRPNTLNGFGLGTTLPTALVDLEGSTTARASLRIRSGSAPTSPNDGDIWNSGTDLFVRLGGTTYTLQKI